MNRADTLNPGEYTKEGTSILLDAFKDDAVTNFVGLPKIVRNWAMSDYYGGIVKNSRLVLKEAGGKLEGICAYERKGGNDNKGGHIPIVERFLDKGARLFINSATRGRYGKAVQFFELMEEKEKIEMPGEHLSISQIGVKDGSQGKGLGRSMIQEVISVGEKKKIGVWLYTVDEKNINFYQSCGFIIISSGVHNETGLEYWTFGKEFQDTLGETQRKVENILYENP